MYSWKAMGISITPHFSKFKVWLLAGFLIALTLSTYFRVCSFQFVNYDDNKQVSQNPYLIKGFSQESLTWAVTGGLTHQSPYSDYWHPLTNLSRILDVSWFGLKPAGHHTVNLFLHLCNVLFLFFLFGKLTQCWIKSCIIAAIFSIHPIQIETVAWITARKDLLSVFFGLISLLAYVKSRKTSTFVWFVVAALFYLFAMLSKPIPIFPIFLLLLDYWPLERLTFSGGWKSIVKIILEKIPFFALSLLGLLTFHSAYFSLKHSLMHFFVRIISAYRHYLSSFFYPVHMGIYGPSMPVPKPAFEVIAMGCILVGISFLALRRAKDLKFLVTGWAWFFIGLIPMVSFDWEADRFLYLPVVGLALVCVWGAEKIFNLFSKSKVIPILFAVMALIFLWIWNARQLGYWQNTKSLFQRALEINPNNYVAHNNLGIWLSEEGHEREANWHFRKSLSNPNYIQGYVSLGVAAARQGKISEAFAYYSEAIRRDANAPVPYSNYANLLMMLGRSKEAITFYQKALILDPLYLTPHLGLGNAFAREGRLDESAMHFSKALEIQPDLELARAGLARTRDQQARKNRTA